MVERRKLNNGGTIRWNATNEQANALISGIPNQEGFERRRISRHTNKELPDNWFLWETNDGDEIVVILMGNKINIVKCTIGAVPVVTDIAPQLQRVKSG